MKKSVKITLAVLFPAIFAASCILGGVLAYKKYSRKTVDVSATVTEDEWVNAVEKTSLAANFTFDQRNLTIRKKIYPDRVLQTRRKNDYGAQIFLLSLYL